MAIFKEKIKVLLYGNVHGAYRCENLIKFLLDSGYYVSFVYPDFYLRGRGKQTFFTQFIRKVFSKFYLIELFVKAALADVIYVLPMSGNFIQSALWVSKLFKNKLVIEPYISMYDTYVRNKDDIKEGSKAAKEILKKDILAFTKTDYIIHLSAYELAYWAKVLDIELDPNKVFIAPLFTESRLSLKRQFMQDGSLNICWWGTILPLHGVDNILQAMKILKEKELPFTCNLFGAYGSGYAERFHAYENKIKQDELSDRVFLRKDLKFSDGSLPKYLVENCDLALGVFGNNERARNSATPNKLVESLAMGIPTLNMNFPGLKEFLNPEVDFWTCEPTGESIAQTILAIINGTAPAVDWEQTRQKALNTFSLTRYQEVVTKVLDKVEDDLQKE
jgi:glycosyltransferase involved in cell wall biosynthesis